MKINLLIILFSLFLFQNCQRNKLGLEVKYYDNGNIEYIKNYDYQKLQGEAVWFFANGRLKQKIIFEMWLENGHAYYFYESGALESHRYWRNGKMVGYVADYWDDRMSIIKNVLYFNENGDLLYKKEFDSLGNYLREEGKKPEQ